MNFAKKIKYLVCIFLVVAIGSSAFQKTAYALFAGIPISYPAAEIEAAIISGSVSAAVKPCTTAVEALSIKKSGQNLASRAASAVTLGITSIASDTEQTAEIDATKAICATANAALDGIRLTAIYPPSATIVQHGSAEINTALERLEAMQQEIDQHHSLAQSVFWKAIFSKVFLTVSKTLVTRMVSKLNTVYKINDFGKYADAVGSTVYQAQRIQDATDNKVQQAMVRSMITDNSFANQIHPAATASAKLALGFDPADVSFEDKNLLDNIFALSLSSNNALDVDMAMRQTSGLVVGASQRDALTEISQSSYKSPRSCNQATLNEQEKIDNEYKKKAEEVNELYATYIKLNNDLINGSPDITQEDVKDFKNAYIQGLKALDELPKQVNNPVLVACGAITSPAEFISGRIGTMLDNYAKNISDPKTDNMPIAIAAVADIASNFASKLILGIGEGGSSAKSSVINEDAKLATGNADGIDYQTEGAGDPASETQSKIKLDYTRGSKEGEITITWDATERKNAESVRLEGPGVVSTDEKDGPSTSLRGSYDVTITEDSTFTLTVLVKATAKNPEPKIKTLQVPLVEPNINTRGSDDTTPDGGPGQVQGQFSRISIQPRGPILPRN